MLSRFEAVLLAALAAALLAYLLVPSRGLVFTGHLLLIAGPVLAAAMAATAARRGARGATPTWILLAFAAAFVAAGQSVWAVRQLVLEQALPFPSVPFFFFLAFHPLYAAALILSLRASDGVGSRGEAVQDALLACAAIAVALLRFVYEPMREARPWLTEAELGWIMTGQFLAQLSLVAAILVVVWRRTVLPPRATALLVLAALVNGGANLLQLTGADPNAGAPGDPFELAWLLGWGLFAAAGAAGSSVRPTVWTGRSAVWLGRRLRQAVTVVVVLVMTVTMVHVALYRTASLPTVATLGVLGCLLALRLAVALGAAEREQRKQNELARTRVLVELSRTLAMAPRVEGALAQIGSAALDLLDGRRAWVETHGTNGTVGVIAQPDGTTTRLPLGRSCGRWLGGRRAAQVLTGPELEVDGPDGRPLPARVWLAGAVVRFGGRVTGAIAVERTDRGFDAGELELLGGLADQAAVVVENGRLVEETRQAERDRLQSEKLAGLGQLAAGVAHEINNPLAAIHSAAVTLAVDDDGPDRDEIVQIIRTEAARAARIVRGMLDFVRPPELDLHPVDPAALLRSVVAARRAEHERLRIEVAAELGELPPVLANGGGLEQVFHNLVVNAEHALGRVDGERRLVLSGGVEGSTVLVRVRDTGPGIPEEHLGRIFDPFFTTKPPGQGTGLGLSVSYGILRELGGSIEVDSRPGRGTTFTVRLPAADETGGVKGAADTVTQAAAGGLRILLVEDEASIRRLVGRFLRRLGHSVETAENGREALDRLRDGEFDVILTDLKMPVLGGDALYDRLRQTDPATAERVVFISGDTVAEETRAFLARSGRPFISKPFDLDALAALVASLGTGRG